MKNLFNVLGIEPTLSLDELFLAFKKLYEEYEKRGQLDSLKFQEIQAAFVTLKDKQLLEKYYNGYKAKDNPQQSKDTMVRYRARPGAEISFEEAVEKLKSGEHSFKDFDFREYDLSKFPEETWEGINFKGAYLPNSKIAINPQIIKDKNLSSANLSENNFSKLSPESWYGVDICDTNLSKTGAVIDICKINHSKAGLGRANLTGCKILATPFQYLKALDFKKGIPFSKNNFIGALYQDNISSQPQEYISTNYEWFYNEPDYLKKRESCKYDLGSRNKKVQNHFELWNIKRCNIDTLDNNSLDAYLKRVNEKIGFLYKYYDEIHPKANGDKPAEHQSRPTVLTDLKSAENIFQSKDNVRKYYKQLLHAEEKQKTGINKVYNPPFKGKQSLER